MDTLHSDEVVEGVEVGGGTLAACDAGEAQERLPLLLLALRYRKDRGRVRRDVADRQLAQREIVVRLLERRQTGKDHIGVSRSLVHVDVEADHQLERVEGAIEPSAVRRA